MSLSDEIDALYRLPLGAFTPARNALARRMSPSKAAVMALEKPALAAWAVNQLYWHQRKTFDALVRASEARRRAHVRRVAGASTSLADLDARHREALAVASAVTLTLLRDSGATVSPATEAAITQTLDAVPSPNIAGRLTTPVAAAGFSMLAALVASTPRALSTRDPATVVHIGRTATPTTDGRTRAALRVARQHAARALTAARVTERRVSAALAAARAAVRTADQLIERLDAQLRDARAAADARREALARATASVNDAAAARVDAERRLRALD